jgi:hypothetical protein
MGKGPPGGRRQAASIDYRRNRTALSSQIDHGARRRGQRRPSAVEEALGASVGRDTARYSAAGAAGGWTPCDGIVRAAATRTAGEG